VCVLEPNKNKNNKTICVDSNWSNIYVCRLRRERPARVDSQLKTDVAPASQLPTLNTVAVVVAVSVGARPAPPPPPLVQPIQPIHRPTCPTSPTAPHPHPQQPWKRKKKSLPCSGSIGSNRIVWDRLLWFWIPEDPNNRRPPNTRRPTEWQESGGSGGRVGVGGKRKYEFGQHKRSNRGTL